MTTKQNSCKNKGKNFYLFLIMGAVALVAFLMIVPLLVEAAHAADVTLEWDPSEGQDVNGYFLCYGMQSGDYSVSMDVGNATTSTVAGLEPGDTYYFAVYAYNSYGESDYSNEVSYTPPFPTVDTHTITASAGANGYISPSGATVVNDGSSQTFTMVPDAGYRVENVLVDNVSKGSVLTWTFNDVIGDHTITASFASSNLSPVANAGPDQTVGEGAQVVLNGSNSTDPDNNIESYFWTQTSGVSVVLSNPESSQPSFTSPDVGPNGASLVFQLTVTDSQGLESQDSCIVNVTWENESPVADAGEEQEVFEGTFVTLDGSGSYDGDDGIAAYEWVQTAGIPVVISNPGTSQASFESPDVGPDGSSLVFQLTVFDNGGLTSQDTCIVNVTWENIPPVADAGEDQEVSEGTLVTLNGSGSSDSDDGIVSYQWTQTDGTPVVLSDSGSIQPTFTAPEVGEDVLTLTFQLVVTDGGGLQSQDTCTVTVVQDAGENGEEVIELKEGWNLVSLNKQPENTDITAVLASISGKYNSVWLFDDGTWKIYNPDKPKFNTLSTMEVGYGYWIDMKEAATLVVSTIEYNISSIELVKGWNMVSYHGDSALPVADAIASIQGVCISVWEYDKTWKVYDPSNPQFSNLKFMRPGYGYWINVSQPCTWVLP